MAKPLNFRHAIATALAGVILQQVNLPATASFNLQSIDSSIGPSQGQLISNKDKKNNKKSSSSSSSPSTRPEQRPRRQLNEREGNRRLQNSRNGSPRNGSPRNGSSRDGNPSKRLNQQPKSWKDFKESRRSNTRLKDKNVYKKSNITSINKRVTKKAVYRGGWGRRQGWVGARPWGYGWYGGWGPGVVVYPGWVWWGGLAPSWGVVSLSPTVVIQMSVDEAVSNDDETIRVPNTEYRVYHSSIKPISENEIEFNFETENQVYLVTANCKEGLLNYETPSASDEAELMHSACTIAFNSFAET